MQSVKESKSLNYRKSEQDVSVNTGREKHCFKKTMVFSLSCVYKILLLSRGNVEAEETNFIKFKGG